ncbi:succinate dehydrogenase assembly factor 2 [Methylocystis sp. MJC1]|jgi:antitoxin CptB|uniref:FAD assembly factor SdhE n=1 Tax=Methylocystis sp. MJC1 TaxID=2654282 RepID=UPI0013ED0E0E|nr:succinate dehydrogenase assembly factor 2 [Methylocystis sp. MJC1]MBU6525957.1 succinate dehydrogenase assembly factor 2 [Methylocystis sp. MJC1]UZX12424.1 succinate dehydrogenase assembly factor 2 [Methylocystis sp. MJC1]
MIDYPQAGDDRPSESDIRRRRIRVRAWRRGMRELDILIGGFVDARIDALSEAELDELEVLLDLPDAELLSWLAGGAEPPQERDTALLKAIIAFHTHDGPIH